MIDREEFGLRSLAALGSFVALPRPAVAFGHLSHAALLSAYKTSPRGELLAELAAEGSAKC